MTRKTKTGLVGDYHDQFGVHVAITEPPHVTDAGAYPDGYKIEWADGQCLTVDGADTAQRYVDLLNLVPAR